MSRRKSRRRNPQGRGGAGTRLVGRTAGRRDPTRPDPYQRAARAEGYRARSAYKLTQIDTRFRLFKPGMVVLDLGAAPGGWSQIAAELVAGVPPPQEVEALPEKPAPEESAPTGGLPTGGRVIGLDLKPIEPWPGCTFLRGDVTLPETLEGLADLCSKGEAAGLISDMSPSLSGNYDLDQARSAHLAEMALTVAQEWLKPGGFLVVKVFEGSDFQTFRQKVRAAFGKVRTFTPPASRKASSEVYLVAKGFRPAAGAAKRREG